MKNNFKKLIALAITLALTCLCAFPAWAAKDEGTPIDSFSIDISYSTFQAGDDADENDIEVTIEGGTNAYSIDDKMMLTRPSGYWKSGTIPRFKVTLIANGDYYFSTACTKLSDAKEWVSGDVEVTGVSRIQKDHSMLSITMNLAEVEGDDPEPDDDGPGSIPKPSVTGPGAANPNQGRTNGAWLYNEKAGWWFVNPDGTQTKNGWQYIDNKWYWFNEYGYMLQNNWVLYKNKWYFCGPNGDMYVYRFTPDGYWVDRDGVWTPSK